MGRRVLCCGTFDYLHPGHISFLRQASRLGSELFVVVARDENVKRIKGRFPDQDEQERKARIEELDFVDDAVLARARRAFATATISSTMSGAEILERTFSR